MNASRKLLFVLGCVVCLMAVASALPAADPRIGLPGTDDPGAGEWDAIEDRPDFDSGSVHDDDPDARTDTPGDTDHPGDPDVEIQGQIDPGNEVLVELDSGHPQSEKEVLVNGERAGETDWGELEIVIPYEEEVTIAIPDKEFERTFDVETDATVESSGGAVPTGEIEISATVGTVPVEDAAVFVGGERAGTTDEDGTATVQLPETAGWTEIRVEREPVVGTHQIEVAQPEVEFVSPFLFPGSPAPVQVSADGTGVPNATVEVEGDGPVPVDGGDEATTSDRGMANVWLPVGDEATVTVTAGEETTTTSVGNLYLRLGALVVFVPGFAIGAVVTYLRVVAAYERRTGHSVDGLSVGFARLFVGFADVLGSLLDDIANAPLRFGAVSGVFSGSSRSSAGSDSSSGGLRLPSLPRISISGPGSSGRGLPSLNLGSALASFGSALGSLSALGSIGSSSRRAGRSLFGGTFIDDRRESRDSGESPKTSRDSEDSALAPEPLGPPAPSAEIRTAWHVFLDRVEIRDRETLTPGRAARRALRAGFPAAHVGRIVSIFRAVEYGGRDPSPERVVRARETAAELVAHDPDEDDQDDDSEGGSA